MARIEGPRGKRGSYRISVYLGKDETGKKIFSRKTFIPEYNTSKGNPKSNATIRAEVEAEAIKWEKELRKGLSSYSDNKMTVSELCDSYLKSARLTQAPSAYQSSESAIKKFKLDFGYIALRDLNAAFLQNYVNDILSAKSAKGIPYAQSTVQRRMGVLSAALSGAVRMGIIEVNPMDKVIIRKADSLSEEKTNIFDSEQATRFLAALDDDILYNYSAYERRNPDSSNGSYQSVSEYTANRPLRKGLKLFFYIALYEGPRRGEVLALTWDDIDFEKKTITFNKAINRKYGKTFLKVPKTKHSVRTMSVADKVLDAAREAKEEQDERINQMGSTWKSPGELWKTLDEPWDERDPVIAKSSFIFTQKDGTIMHIDTPYKAFKRLIAHYNAKQTDDAMKLPEIRLHDLRKTNCSLLLAEGVDVATVSKRLGHGRKSTTLDNYTEPINQKDKGATEVLSAVLG